MTSLIGECFLTSYSTQTVLQHDGDASLLFASLPENTDTCGGNTAWGHKEEKQSRRWTARALLSPHLSGQDLFPHRGSPTAPAPGPSLTARVASDVQAHVRTQQKLQGKGPPAAAFSLPSLSLGRLQQTAASA